MSMIIRDDGERLTDTATLIIMLSMVGMQTSSCV